MYIETTRDFEVFIGGETSTSTPGKNDRGQAGQLNERNLVWQWFSPDLENFFLYPSLLRNYPLRVNETLAKQSGKQIDKNLNTVKHVKSLHVSIRSNPFGIANI